MGSKWRTVYSALFFTGSSLHDMLPDEQIDARPGATSLRRLELADAIALLRGRFAGGVTSESLPLIDRYTQRRLKAPVRGDGCEHTECFDHSTFEVGRCPRCFRADVT